MPVKARTPAEMLEFLQTNVHRDEDCLVWAGQVNSKSGGPKVSWRRKMHQARRLMLTLMGESIEGKKITQTCEHPLCMNRAHLILLTQQQLLKRASAKGHWQVGAIRVMRAAVGKADTAKMSIKEARTVLKMRAEGATYREIGQKYGVNQSRVGMALKTWARAGVTL